MNLYRLAKFGLVIALLLVLPAASHAQEPGGEVDVFVPNLTTVDSMIAFTQSEYRPGLYTMTPNGERLHRLTWYYINVTNPAWSPDGRQLAFLSNAGAYWDIYLIHADGSGLTNLTNSPGIESAPSWSPDGTRLTFSVGNHGMDDIMVMDADGSNLINLTNTEFMEREPIWSPNGEQIAYYCPGWHGSSTPDICVMKIDGNETKNLTQNESTEGRIAWSPDSQTILFDSFRAWNRDIYTVPARGGNQTRLTTVEGEDYNAAWSPDGNSIAYVSYPQNSQAELTIMNADGNNKRVVYSNPDSISDPDWSPDGGTLLFEILNNLYRVNIDGTELVNLTQFRRR